MPTLNLSIVADTEDGHQVGTWQQGYQWLGKFGGVLEAPAHSFANVTVPKNSTISSATWTLTKIQSSTAPTGIHAKAWAQAIDNASLPAGDNLPLNWTLTTASSSTYTPTDWLESTTIVLDVTTVIQELVNRAGWASGNRLNLLLKDDGTTVDNSEGKIYDFTDNAAKAGTLSITYTAAGGGGVPPIWRPAA